MSTLKPEAHYTASMGVSAVRRRLTRDCWHHRSTLWQWRVGAVLLYLFPGTFIASRGVNLERIRVLNGEGVDRRALDLGISAAQVCERHPNRFVRQLFLGLVVIVVPRR